MNRPNLLLSIAIALELATGAFVLIRPAPTPPLPSPPVPVLTVVDDPLVAWRIRDLAGKCRTPAEWAELGELYHAFGYFAEGEVCYRVARDREPDNPNWWYYWAFARERIGRPKDAVVGYEEAVKRGHSDAAGCWYCVGQNQLRLQNPEAARMAFEKAGDYPAAFYERAKLLTRDGQYDEAVALLDRATAKDKVAVDPWLLRHKIETLRDRPAPAAVYADKAKFILGAPHLPNPLFSREWDRLEDLFSLVGHDHGLNEAQTHLDARDWPAAQSALEGAESEWDPQAEIIRAKIAYRQGRFEEMARLAQEIIDRSGSSALALDALGDGLAALGQSEKAVRAWTQATELGDGIKVKEPHHKLAEYFRKAGKMADANRHESRSFFASGHDGYWKGKFAEAKAAFEEAVKLDSSFAAAWFYLGDANRQLGESAKARETYRRCLELDPNFGRAHRGLFLLDAKP